jgi:hypothetical protein
MRAPDASGVGFARGAGIAPPGAMSRFRSEDGSILIMTMVAMLVMIGFSAMVFDQGVRLTARTNAQTQADAGAMSGAIARYFDEAGVNPPAAGGITEQSIQAVVNNNVAFGGTVRGLTWSWPCPPWAAGGGGGTLCVTVNVFQDGTNGSGNLPTFFANAFGIGQQQTRATATAEAVIANATDCLRPFGVPDLWFEENMPPSPGVFKRYELNGNSKGQLITDPDRYVPATSTSAGSGYTVAANYGNQFTLKYGVGGGPSTNQQQPGWFQPLSVAQADGDQFGANVFKENIANCNGQAYPLGSKIPTETGAMQGPAKQGIGALIAKDANAQWDPTTNAIVGSCVPTCGAFSPRVITLALYDTDDFQRRTSQNDWSGCPGGGSCITVVNFMGFFVDHMLGNGDVVGYLIRNAGLFVAGEPAVGAGSSFLAQIQLIR